jgi:hypothetical protein
MDNFTFDKFMQDIVRREESSRSSNDSYQKGQDESPARQFNKLYREHWQNSTYVGEGRGRWQK